MAENTKIEWAHHTFNPWIGCTKVSPACDHCYAEAWAARYGNVGWGPHAVRRRTKTWGNPVKWNRQAEAEGRRYRVFCASLADVFDNHRSISEKWRGDLWALIRRCEHLDWLLLTKRPQNIAKMLPNDWCDGWRNVWLGTTVENQVEADRRIPHLVNVPARIRFLSCEPLLGPLDLSFHLAIERVSLSIGPHWTEKVGDVPRVHWVIAGGESGPNHRPSNPDWFCSLRAQCAAADVPFLFKQWGGRTPKAGGRELDGRTHDGYPAAE